MPHSVFVPLGISSTWIAREIISGEYAIEPVNDNYVTMGKIEVNMGPYWVQVGDKKLLVLPASPGFKEEGGIERWAGNHRTKAKRIAGLGWCGSRIRDSLGKIVVPETVSLSKGLRKYESMGGGQADSNLREKITEGIRTKDYSLLEGTSCTVLDPEESVKTAFDFGDMEAGLLIRYGNANRIPTACSYIVSDAGGERLDINAFIQRVKRELREPYKAALESIITVLKA